MLAQLWGGAVLALVLLFTCSACSRFEGPHKEVSFIALREAERLLVTATRSGAVLLDTTERTKIVSAAQFAQRHQSGWREVWPGPLAPAIVLEFYKGGDVVGTFGVAQEYLTLSGWSRPMKKEEIQQLLRALELPSLLP